MSIPGSANPLLLASAVGAGGYEIERSLRFNSADSAYLSRTPSVSGDRKTWTWAAWVKRSALGRYSFFSSGSSINASFSLGFDSYDRLWVYNYTSAFDWQLVTTSVYRDPSAWYHMVLSVDTTQGTASNRVRLYVNGTEVTTFTTATYPSSNADTYVSTATLHTIGCFRNLIIFTNGYLADIHFIDGQALDPTSFTEVDATTGQLVPIAYSGTYGTNGFHLPFSDNSTAAALGTDTSGNSNTWTVNNISVAAGAGNDSLVDTPTSYGTDTGAGGEVRGNYATLNPLDNGGLILTNGNLNFSRASASWASCRATIGISSGKWYWEISGTGNWPLAGIMKGTATLASFAGGDANGWGYYSGNGQKYTAGSGSSYGATWTDGAVIGVAFDADNGTLTFYKNNSSQGIAFTGLTSGPYFPAVGIYDTATCYANFGQRPFAYTAPSGYKALCTTNLPDPVVAQPSTVMDVALYTGTSNTGTVTVSGLAFSPDLVWVKNRTNANRHGLADTIRGVNNSLAPNRTDGELTTQTDLLTSFNSDGFTVGGDAVQYGWNWPSASFVAWCWDAGSSTVTNTDGSITSQVRANASAGFSIVTYTGTNAAATVGHGLNVAPYFVIVKSRSNPYSWVVWHNSFGTAGNTDYLFLESTTSKGGLGSYDFWNNAVPTSSVIHIGTQVSVNTSGLTYVAYCFSPVAGYSSGFSYTGNGSTDGSFVYLGFRPRLILLKCSSTTGNWTLLDTAREGYNVDNDPLYPNLSNVEGTTDLLDITSNGFKLRTTDASVNSSGATYVGYAWAEAPFAYSRAR